MAVTHSSPALNAATDAVTALNVINRRVITPDVSRRHRVVVDSNCRVLQPVQRLPYDSLCNDVSFEELDVRGGHD